MLICQEKWCVDSQHHLPHQLFIFLEVKTNNCGKLYSSMIPFWGNVTNLDQNLGYVLILVLFSGKHNFWLHLFKFTAKIIAFYEVNCKIQFTKINCAENWWIFMQECMTHVNFLYMRKLYIHIRIWSETMSSRMESG